MSRHMRTREWWAVAAVLPAAMAVLVVWAAATPWKALLEVATG